MIQGKGIWASLSSDWWVWFHWTYTCDAFCLTFFLKETMLMHSFHNKGWDCLEVDYLMRMIYDAPQSTVLGVALIFTSGAQHQQLSILMQHWKMSTPNRHWLKKRFKEFMLWACFRNGLSGRIGAMSYQTTCW